MALLGGVAASKVMAPKAPDMGAMQASADKKAAADQAATETSAAQAANAKLAAQQKRRTASLLSTGAPADGGALSVLGGAGKSTLGQ